MDYSKITLGELLSSPIETIRRNAIAILKTLQRQEKDYCPSGHKQDADGGCKCTNRDGK